MLYDLSLFNLKHWTLLALQSESATTSAKKQRINFRNLTDEQKAQLEGMSSCQDMPYEERKRQYAALGGAVKTYNSPQLSAKYKLASDSERFLDNNFLLTKKLPFGLESLSCFTLITNSGFRC